MNNSNEIYKDNRIDPITLITMISRDRANVFKTLADPLLEEYKERIASIDPKLEWIVDIPFKYTNLIDKNMVYRSKIGTALLIDIEYIYNEDRWLRDIDVIATEEQYALLKKLERLL